MIPHIVIQLSVSLELSYYSYSFPLNLRYTKLTRHFRRFCSSKYILSKSLSYLIHIFPNFFIKFKTSNIHNSLVKPEFPKKILNFPLVHI